LVTKQHFQRLAGVRVSLKSKWALKASVSLSIRPIRFGFLVDPRNPDSILHGIRLSSSLWGAQFNPLIPVTKRLPEAWKEFAATATSVTHGYIRAFDPDVLVPCEGVYGKSFEGGGREVISASEIDLHEPGDRRRTGMSLVEACYAFVNEELQFVRKLEPRIIIPRVKGSHGLLGAAVFGDLPQSVEEGVLRAFRLHSPVEHVDLEMPEFSKLMDLQYQFPRRLSRYGLERHRQSEHWGSIVVHVIDGNSPLDVLDYWNMRALGWSVVVLPVEFASAPAMQSFLNADMANIAATIGGGTLRPAVAIVKGRTISEGQSNEATRALELPQPKSKDRVSHPVSRYNWYPRIWDEFGRYADSAEPNSVSAGSKRYSVGYDEFSDEVRTVAPKWMKNFGQFGARFANDVEIAAASFAGDIAEVLPEGSTNVAMASGIKTGLARLSRRGPVVLGHSGDEPLFFEVPKAEPTMKSWLASQGLPLELSPAGQTAKATLARLGSLTSLGMFELAPI
jgi:hypothetical protein